jgi:hypothetical protein
MSKDEITKKNNYTKGFKKIRVRKNINQRDKKFQLEGLIELKNSFNKRRKKNKKNESQTKKNKTIKKLFKG